MAAIVISTAKKTAELEKLYNDTAENKFLNPSEFGAPARVASVSFTADEEITTSIPIVLGRFDRPVKLLAAFLKTSSAITAVNVGVTPISLPVDTVSQIAAASTAFGVANVAVSLAGMFNYTITEPSYLVLKPTTGSLADEATITGSILYVENL